MFNFRKRLSLVHKRQAVRVAKDYVNDSGTDAELKAKLKADPRLVGIDPALIALFIQVVLAVIKFMRERQKTPASLVEQTDDEIYLASLRYQE